MSTKKQKPDTPEVLQAAESEGTATASEPAAAESEPVTPEKPATSAGPRRRGGGLALLAFLVAVGTAGGGYWLWTQLEHQRLAMAQDSQALQGRLAQLAAEQRELATRLGLASTALDQVHSDTQLLTEALDKINERLGRDRHGWVVAEAEYLLQLANRRLLLERDVAGAIAALAAADRRLASLNDPLFTRTRSLISEELQALRALPQLDVEGLALELGALSKAVDSLVLAGTPRQEVAEEAVAEEATGWRAFTQKLWEDIRGLVKIRHHEAGSLPLLTPDQRLLLRQNLRLKLETARLALLRGQGPIYTTVLQEADEWVARFYDGESAATAGIREALGRLSAIDIAPELPAIDQSLHALRETGAQSDGGERP